MKPWWLIGCALIVFPAQADFKDWLKGALDKKSTTLDAQTATDGLKEALHHGLDRAVTALAQENGYFGNVRVKIPMPEELRKLEKGLRRIGKDKTADEFILSLNRAAEAAAPKARAIFGNALKTMTVQDALGIVKGEANAATTFFRKTSEGELMDTFRPIVKNATDKVGVTRRYKELVTKYSWVAKLTDSDRLDLDRYVTQKALDGLFLLIEDEERRIRADPVARTSELLRKVFGNKP
jgi:hypothetical protein